MRANSSNLTLNTLLSSPSTLTEVSTGMPPLSPLFLESIHQAEEGDELCIFNLLIIEIDSYIEQIYIMDNESPADN